jgi:hypothetical protein
MAAKRWHSVWDPSVPKVFEPDKSLLDSVRDNAIAGPDRVALSFYGFDITYQQLDQATNRFASGLANLGVKKRDRVALLLQNCPQFVISYLGTLRAGAIVVSLNPMFKHTELEYELSTAFHKYGNVFFGTQMNAGKRALGGRLLRPEGPARCADCFFRSLESNVQYLKLLLNWLKGALDSRDRKKQNAGVGHPERVCTQIYLAESVFICVHPCPPKYVSVFMKPST